MVTKLSILILLLKKENNFLSRIIKYPFLKLKRFSKKGGSSLSLISIKSTQLEKNLFPSKS